MEECVLPIPERLPVFGEEGHADSDLKGYESKNQANDPGGHDGEVGRGASRGKGRDQREAE